MNAAHAIGDVVKGTGQKGTIRIETRLEGTMALISIADTGAGIPENIHGRIFDQAGGILGRAGRRQAQSQCDGPSETGEHTSRA